MNGGDGGIKGCETVNSYSWVDYRYLQPPPHHHHRRLSSPPLPRSKLTIVCLDRSDGRGEGGGIGREKKSFSFPAKLITRSSLSLRLFYPFIPPFLCFPLILLLPQICVCVCDLAFYWQSEGMSRKRGHSYPTSFSPGAQVEVRTGVWVRTNQSLLGP